ncbi:MAG: hypothetical protein LBH05_03295 [Deferribacteraceae bacterium]|jgi:tetratricopeptide (TPR) repeat protein|nr:hypothetical protein [Deferribacteraceae bacterium]
MRNFLLIILLLYPFLAAAQDNESIVKINKLENMLIDLQRQIAVNNEETQKQIKLLSDKVDMINSDKQRRKTLAAESYRKAVKFTSEKQYQTAGIYYGNALALDPDNITILNSYTKAVTEWVSSRQNLGDYDSAYQTLSDYIRYLYTFPAGLPAEGADYLVSTFWALTEYQTKLSLESEGKKLQQSNIHKKEIEKNIYEELNLSLADNETFLTEKFRNTQLLFAQWQRVAPNDVYLTDLLNKRLLQITDNIEALNLLRYGEESIKSSKQADGISPYYAASELYITNQRLINLKTSLIPSVLKRVDKFGKDLDSLSGAITSDSAKITWERINKRKNEIAALVGKTKTKEAAAKLWSNFAEEVTLELPRTANPDYSAQIRLLLSEINQKLSVLREEQLFVYEKWGLQNISTMHKHYKDEIGMLKLSESAQKRIIGGMKDYLCPVDTRYLSMTGMKLYNEIFDLFNKELNREQRISVALQFSECKRKPLSDF